MFIKCFALATIHIYIYLFSLYSERVKTYLIKCTRLWAVMT